MTRSSAAARLATAAAVVVLVLALAPAPARGGPDLPDATVETARAWFEDRADARRLVLFVSPT